MPLVIRDSTDTDLPAITAIYDHAVRNGTGSFETDPPDIDEMIRRRHAVLEGGYPYLVAENDGEVVGYCYANTYNKRHAYRFSFENSVYVAPNNRKQGVGHALLEELLARCEKAGYRLAIAIIGDSANIPSIRLHAAHGFQKAGQLPNVGWKHGNWRDVVFMVRPLGSGATEPPPSNH